MTSIRLKSKYWLKHEPSADVIRAYIAQQTCWICGKGGWKALCQHLVKKHGLPANEVREMAYMFKRERLVSEELSQVLSESCLKKLGDKVCHFKKGEKQSRHILSTKAKDIVRKRVEEIRPLAALAQRKRRKTHHCKVCGKIVETSRPYYCSPECSHIAWSESAKKMMTPERIALFKTTLYKPTPEELSATAKRMWEKIRSWPIEKQREYNLRRAASRRKRVTRMCLICGKKFDIIPSQVGKIVTCRDNECKKEAHRLGALGRKHTPDAIVKMSAHAKARHINEPLFGRNIR